MSRPERLLVICPGRGSYGAEQLNTLASRCAIPGAEAIVDDLVGRADRLRGEAGLPLLSELDGAERFSPARHLPGPNAGPLIYTCSAIDLALVPRERWRVAGVAGNSMGFYTALHASGVFAFEEAFRLVQTMSSSQQDGLVGGQSIFPVVDEEWRPDPARRQAVELALREAKSEGLAAFVSIELGGFVVLAGDEGGLAALERGLPKTKLGTRDYPFRLAQHAAFHTPLMSEASRFGRERLSDLPWRGPALPLADGAGRIRMPRSTSGLDLLSYTLIDQVLTTYDFTASLRSALRELAPDRLLLLGPGDSLGGAIGQTLVREGWQGIRSKSEFLARQKSLKPILIAMGRDDQRARFLSGA